MKLEIELTKEVKALINSMVDQRVENILSAKAEVVMMRAFKNSDPGIFEGILDSYCENNKINKDLLLCSSRKRDLIEHRMILIYTLKEKYHIKESLLSKIFNRDRGTIYNALDRAVTLFQTDKYMRNRIEYALKVY